MNMIRTASNNESDSSNREQRLEQRTRELAYQIWETEGCPDGQRDRHWEMARKLAEIETRDEPQPNARARRITKPSAAPVASQPKDAPIIVPPQQPQTRSRTSRPKLDA